jgi:hypothetical protein
VQSLIHCSFLFLMDLPLNNQLRFTETQIKKHENEVQSYASLGMRLFLYPADQSHSSHVVLSSENEQ